MASISRWQYSSNSGGHGFGFSFTLRFTSFLKFDLLGTPSFQHLNGAPLGRQLDVGVDRVDIFTAGMAHEGLADFLHNACFHEASVIGVPQIVEPVSVDTRSANSGEPC